ncbi:MAG: hypothetical protein A2X94_07200 [Bdellovibrionales bacterium GWB1_55_8]|nr:MAG: hypothetical protein A2X94_07200 [Bdellovibrionales bacterium GWB1_55_8]
MANIHAIRATENRDEAEVRQAIEDFAQAFRAKDLQGILSCYAPRIVAFDLMPPLQHSGIAAWRTVWKKSLPMMTGDITFEFSDLNIDVSGNLAVCHGLNHFMMKNGEAVDMWIRWTGAFRKIDGKWLVTHEHTSVPSDMDSGKALMDLKP